MPAASCDTKYGDRPAANSAAYPQTKTAHACASSCCGAGCAYVRVDYLWVFMGIGSAGCVSLDLVRDPAAQVVDIREAVAVVFLSRVVENDELRGQIDVNPHPVVVLADRSECAVDLFDVDARIWLVPLNAGEVVAARPIHESMIERRAAHPGTRAPSDCIGITCSSLVKQRRERCENRVSEPFARPEGSYCARLWWLRRRPWPSRCPKEGS